MRVVRLVVSDGIRRGFAAQAPHEVVPDQPIAAVEANPAPVVQAPAANAGEPELNIDFDWEVELSRLPSVPSFSSFPGVL